MKKKCICLLLVLLFCLNCAVSFCASAYNGDVIVYVTDTGTKYHRAGCGYLSKSKNSISLENAVYYGYTPCSRCGPPRLDITAENPDYWEERKAEFEEKIQSALDEREDRLSSSQAPEVITKTVYETITEEVEVVPLWAKYVFAGLVLTVMILAFVIRSKNKIIKEMQTMIIGERKNTN